MEKNKGMEGYLLAYKLIGSR